MISVIEQYKPIIKFFALYLGDDTEILLSDTEKVIYAENPLEEGHKPGMPIGDIERSLVEKRIYADIDYTINYRSLTQSRKRLRAATFFIKNDKGALIGMMTVNTEVDKLIRLRGMIDDMVNGRQSNTHSVEDDTHKDEYYETISMSIEQVMSSIIEENIARYGVPVERLRPEEKLSIVKKLDDVGAFLVKGSVAEVAQRLSSSEATIYRYLQQINS